MVCASSFIPYNTFSTQWPESFLCHSMQGCQIKYKMPSLNLNRCLVFAKSGNSSPVLKIFPWYSITFKIKSKLFSMTFKCDSDRCPLHLISHLLISYHPQPPPLMLQPSPSAFLESQRMTLSILELEGPFVTFLDEEIRVQRD